MSSPTPVNTCRRESSALTVFSSVSDEKTVHKWTACAHTMRAKTGKPLVSAWQILLLSLRLGYFSREAFTPNIRCFCSRCFIGTVFLGHTTKISFLIKPKLTLGFFSNNKLFHHFFFSIYFTSICLHCTSDLYRTKKHFIPLLATWFVSRHMHKTWWRHIRRQALFYERSNHCSDVRLSCFPAVIWLENVR